MKIKRVVGEGSYGAVVICEKDGEEYALKTVKGDYYGLVSLQEVDVMNGISSPFLVSARKTYIDDNSTLLFMDLADETLHRYRISDENELKMIAFQMVSSLAFLEKRKIVHGDVKANNFLCYKNSHGISLNVRLTDFSLACRSYGIPPMFRMYCSVYRSIESWYSEAECKSDVWALGCCIYELLTRDSQLFPSQDESYDDKYSDTLVEIIPGGSQRVHRRWKPSFDVYISTLGRFADSVGQPLTLKYRKRVDDAERRLECFPKSLNVFVRKWVEIYRGLPEYLKTMLIVDPSCRPSAMDLFHSDFFSEERRRLTRDLISYYDSIGVSRSDGEGVILDGAVKIHTCRIPLEYEEVIFFMSRSRYSRITLISAMDIYSKCKHLEDIDDRIKFTCLFMSLKMTDPANIDLFELDIERSRAPRLVVILDCEVILCQALNYVFYPEDPRIFELTDEQLNAFYV